MTDKISRIYNACGEIFEKTFERRKKAGRQLSEVSRNAFKFVSQ